MRRVSASLRRVVTRRGGGRCEYCHLAQAGQEATFHIDHVTPAVSGGRTVKDNLAVACVSCSLRKAAREKAVDPETGVEVRLYNPRRDQWAEHFQRQGALLIGLTSTGRATIAALDLNRPMVLGIREEQALLGHDSKQ